MHSSSPKCFIRLVIFWLWRGVYLLNYFWKTCFTWTMDSHSMDIKWHILFRNYSDKRITSWHGLSLYQHMPHWKTLYNIYTQLDLFLLQQSSWFTVQNNKLYAFYFHCWICLWQPIQSISVLPILTNHHWNTSKISMLFIILFSIRKLISLLHMYLFIHYFRV